LILRSPRSEEMRTAPLGPVGGALPVIWGGLSGSRRRVSVGLHAVVTTVSIRADHPPSQGDPYSLEACVMPRESLLADWTFRHGPTN
jgi:hypothetical protein